MAHDHLVGGTVGHLIDLLGDVAIARAVRAVLADMQLVAHVAGQRIGARDLGHVEVEGSVEHGDVRQLGILAQAVLDNVGLGVVVERGERGDLADLGENVGVDERGIAEIPAALNHAVADALDLDLVGGKVGKHGLDGDLMVGELHVLAGLFGAIGGVRKGATGKTDSLAGALGRNLMGLGVDDLVLERGRASVDDENVHVSPSKSIYARALRMHIRW